MDGVDDLKSTFNNIIDYKRVTPTSAPDNYRLKNDGNSGANQLYRLLKYSVIEGQKLYVNVTIGGTETNDRALQFQDRESVPTSNNTSHIVGTPIDESFSGYLIAPTGAKYLVLSVLKTDAVSGVYSNKVDEIHSDIDVITSSIDCFMNGGYKRIYPTWEVGYIDSTTGDDIASSEAIRSIGYIDKNAVALWKIDAITGYLYVYQYNYADGVYTFLGRNQRIGNGDFTAWLNGLSCTHIRFINGQTNINYPNSWMTLCLHTQIGDDIETLKPSADKADYLYNQVGYYEKSFDVTAGVNHSSSSDVLPVDFKTGEEFHASVSGDILAPQIYAKYSDSTSERLIIGTAYTGVATKNIVEIGVFIGGGNIISNSNASVVAYKTTGLYEVARNGIAKKTTTTVLGADLPENLAVYGVRTTFAQAMKQAITAWMSTYAGDDSQVPFIVHTDQHGRLTLANQGIFSLMSYLVNWDEVSAIFNLGDTVVDQWTDDATNTNPLLRNATLEMALLCLKDIPKDKQINVYGNHDTWYDGNVDTPIAGTLPSMQYNNPYFISTGLRTEKNPDNSGLMIVYDDKKRIKYLVIAAWDYADKESGNTGYQWYWINQTHYQWIIDKMSENTGHDLVIVSHVPLQMGGERAIDPITNESITKTNPTYIVHYYSGPNALWTARKNKTSGTFSGIPFDFTGCTDDLLCALSGHTHYDGVDRIGTPGLLQVAFDWFADSTIHFGLIDRSGRKIKCWKLSNVSNTPAVQNWETLFDEQET